ncbi:MAG TPA: response regulator [Bryobacteraceae bacterium]|nr:response regulator [Bryobacteraceae bacterium]
MSAGKLLVVDHPAAAQTTAGILHSSGYTVLTAECADQALHAFRVEPHIDFVAAAFTLPSGESGAALIGKVRLCYRSTAVMLIAPPGEESPDPTIPLLVTPFSPSHLVSRVDDLLAGNRRERAALHSTVERNRILREEVYVAELSLRETVQWSRRQHAERFCSSLRTPDVTAPTILVVDDDSVLRYAICRFLSQQGFQVLAAADGDEALKISRDHGPHIDLLLTDLHMPRMTGRELIDIVALERPQTRSLLMTGDNRRLPTPALRKPFELDDLLVEIVALLVKSPR